ncbi:MAG: acetone carboxylase, beta subunit [Solirubrobacterales bacterium]|jgi:N-methylhydantoinase A/acetone carboxylase beta subunit|nr:acetone carboxylase, beta subunit [Solirubrobacterales bacterium]
MSDRPRQVRVLGIDAGGTMTDTILIDEHGEFVIGKAQTTPENESIGFHHSAVDALHYWDLAETEAFPGIASGIFSGTSMLNRLLERKGQRVGLIVSLGMEHYLRLERGVQTHLNYSYGDSLHVVTHRHHEPLVPDERVHGVGGRIDSRGAEAIPLYEHHATAAVESLLAESVDCICVNLLFSYLNPEHEQRVAELARGAMRDAGAEVPLYLSSDLYPKRLDFPRLNTLVIEAYAAEPSRKQLEAVRDVTRELGARFDLRVMAGFGGTISIGSRQLVNTLVSGPIGGVVGAKFLSDLTGMRNVACSDIGGTSFDVALLTDGEYEIAGTPEIAHFKMNFPMVKIDSIGAGTGSFVRVNPVSQRVEFGPDGAGSRIGVANPEGGLETVTITDCNLVIGLLDPDYFLGGEVELDLERARRGVTEQIAEPLGLSLERAAAGVIELFEDELRREVKGLIMGKGYEPADYVLLSYGGGGPLHVGGYTAELNFEDVLVPSWAAGFSAFGCACADFAYRLDRQLDAEIPPGATAAELAAVAERIDAAWAVLEGKVVEEFAKNEVAGEAVEFRRYLRIQYLGQVNDIEVPFAGESLGGPAGVEVALRDFEAAYGKVYAGSARSPELGHLVTLGIVTGSTPVEKPILPEEEPAGAEPEAAASKGTRQVFWRDHWIEATIWEMDALRAGNRVEGAAIIEAPSTTFVVPPGQVAALDRHRIFHLAAQGEERAA